MDYDSNLVQPARAITNWFAVEYRNVAGKAVFTRGGLKFGSDETALRKQYAPALERVALETLLGEAAVWVLWPATAAIWAFPPLVWRLSVDRAILAAAGVFLLVQIAHMLFYARGLNYVVLVLANRLVQALLYTGAVAAMLRADQPGKAAALAAWLLLMALGVLPVIFSVPLAPLLKRVLPRPPADQALGHVARYHQRAT